MALLNSPELLADSDCACHGGARPCGCSSKALAGLSPLQRAAHFAEEPVEPVGEVLTATAVITAATIAADFLGIDLEQLVRDGVSAVLAFFGIGTCSDENKRKYKRMVDAADLPQVVKWLKNKKVGGATETCNEYALAYAARWAKKEADKLKAREEAAEADKPDRAASVRQRMNRPFATRAECVEAKRAAREADRRDGFNWPASLATEMNNKCANISDGTRRQGPCPPTPVELELIGVSRQAYCEAPDGQFQQTTAEIRSLDLTAAEKQKLMALPPAQRAAALQQIVEARGGKMSWLWYALAALAAVGGAVLVWKAID